MKLLLVIYILIHAFYAAGQTLNGSYNTREPIGGVAITFDNEQKMFSYSADNCAGGIFGKGTFNIKKNKLYLYFEKQPQVPEIPIKAPILTVDSIEKKDYIITVKVMNNEEKDTPIPNASIHAVGTKIGAITDSNGVATIKLNYPLTIGRVGVSAIDCESETVYLKGPGTYSITVFIKCGTAIYIDNGQIKTYEIGDEDEDYIELKYIKLSGEKDRYQKYYIKKE